MYLIIYPARRTNMTLKRVSLVLATLALAVTGISLANSQEGGWGERGGHHGARMGGFGAHPARLVQRITRHLDLTEEQEVALENVLEAAKPEVDALKESARSNFRAIRELDPAAADYMASLSNLAQDNGRLVSEGTVLFGRVKSEVYALLTAEQIAEVEAMSERWQERRGSRRGKRR